MQNKINEIVGMMTLKEKASLMSGKNVFQTQEIARLNIPSIFLADGPHGVRKQLAAADHLGLNESVKATCYPTAATIASSWNVTLGEQIGEHLGNEAVSQDVNVLLGPGTNIKRNPLCGRNFEYFSEDPYLSGKMAASYIRGIQSHGIASTVKHYAANNQEERRMSVDSIIDERTLREIYLTPFEIAIKEGQSKAIMSSYNLINGSYVNENKHLMKDILRDEWGFDGVVVTDWGGNNDRIEGLRAGNELEMPSNGGDTNREIVEAVENGKLDISLLDECVVRLLTLICYTQKANSNKAKKYSIDDNHALAQTAAEESIVLLKNSGNLLPLKHSCKVAVIGDFAQKPRYQGAGSSIVNPTKLDNALSCMGDSGLDYIGFAKGFHRFGKKSKSISRQAIKLAAKCDVILLYIGLDEVTEVEGLDRANMRIPKNQLELISKLKATGKKIVAVLSCGSAVEMDWEASCDAIVHAYLGGQAGAKAVLKVITGSVNPSGKLAESYPYKYEDCASSSSFPAHELTSEYREALFVGYRYYDTANVAVRYPFGYGLSYTTFEYSKLSVDKNGVTFTITNTGKYSGAEVAQMYISTSNSRIIRASKELKGFDKVKLEPNVSKSVSIAFDDKTFRFFNVATNSWDIEPCEYKILIGASSMDIRLSATFACEGKELVNPFLIDTLPSYSTGKVASVSLEEFEKLLGHKAPNPHFVFYKKNRLVVDYNTTVAQLKYARGWIGRTFARLVRFAIGFLKVIGKRTTANTLTMGVLNLPMRGMSRMTGGGINWAQLNGLITMFNGHFFKGLGQFRTAGKHKKREKKAAQKAAKATEKTAK